MTTRAQLATDLATTLPDNTSRTITPARVRSSLTALAEAALVRDDDGATLGRLAQAQFGAPVAAMPAIDAGLNGLTVVIDAAGATAIELPASAPKGLCFGVMRYGTGAVTLTVGAGAAARYPIAAGVAISARYGIAFAAVVRNADGSSAEWWIGGEIEAAA